MLGDRQVYVCVPTSEYIRVHPQTSQSHDGICTDPRSSPLKSHVKNYFSNTTLKIHPPKKRVENYVVPTSESNCKSASNDGQMVAVNSWPKEELGNLRDIEGVSPEGTPCTLCRRPLQPLEHRRHWRLGEEEPYVLWLGV